MPYFYNDANGQTQGPFDEQQLQELADRGVITPNTPLATDGGHTGLAGQVRGLVFQIAVPPMKQVFCTNCGNAVSEQAIACMSCGTKPVGHKKFCRHCGAGLNPEQIVCIKCGSEIRIINADQFISQGMNSLGKGIRRLSISATSRGMTVGDIMIFAAAALAVFSFFLPWIGVIGGRPVQSLLGLRNGFTVHAFWFGIIFIFPVWMAFTKKRENIHQIGGYVCAGLGFCLAIMHRRIWVTFAVKQFLHAGLLHGPYRPSSDIGMAEQASMIERARVEIMYATNAGAGVYLFVLACIILVVGIVLIRKPLNHT